MVENPKIPPRGAFDKASEKYSEIAHLDSFKEVKSSLNKKKYRLTHKVPKTMPEFVSLTAESSYRFLLKDSTEDFAILSTNNLIELANGCTKISMDGTFYAVPKFAKKNQTLSPALHTSHSEKQGSA